MVNPAKQLITLLKKCIDLKFIDATYNISKDCHSFYIDVKKKKEPVNIRISTHFPKFQHYAHPKNEPWKRKNISVEFKPYPIPSDDKLRTRVHHIKLLVLMVVMFLFFLLEDFLTWKK